MPRLLITKGPGQGRDHAIGTECVVGRGTDADFTIEDVGISRRHARFHREGDVYVVTDLGSRNGTWVNAQRVQAASLNDGDVIRLGGAELVFRQKDPAAAGRPQAAAVVVPPAVAAVPRAAPAVPVAATPPARPRPAAPAPGTPPAAPAEEPAKKPRPNVVPTRRRGVF
jgi:predicted component of type VI protein secretion system